MFVTSLRPRSGFCQPQWKRSNRPLSFSISKYVMEIAGSNRDKRAEYVAFEFAVSKGCVD